MGYIKEPKGVDFYVDPKPLTKKEEQEISDYIANHKLMITKTKLPKKKRAIRMKKTFA